MKPKKMIFMVILFVFLMTTVPNAVKGDSTELNIPIKTALEILSTKVDSSTKNKLNQFNSDLLSLQVQEQNWDEKTYVIHSNNDQALLEIKQQSKIINADKLVQLKVDVDKAKDFYRPILNVANPTSILLGYKGRPIRFGVQLARQDIQSKEIKLQKAKDATATTIRLIRNTLATIDPINLQIKEARNAVKLQKTRVTNASKSFNLAANKGDTKSAIEGLTTLSTLSRQIVVLKQNENSLEIKISAIIQTIKSQIPAN
jgi:hypothetical protein